LEEAILKLRKERENDAEGNALDYLKSFLDEENKALEKRIQSIT